MKFLLIVLILAVAVRAQEDTTDAYAKDYPATTSSATITAVPKNNDYSDYSKEKLQPPMPYKFAWVVKDEPSQNDYSHQQESDGHVVTGSYRVVLPDGRTQIVNYSADKNGYRAEVKYEGEAQYPAYQLPAYTLTRLPRKAIQRSTKGETKNAAYQESSYQATSIPESLSVSPVTPLNYSESYSTTPEAYI